MQRLVPFLILLTGIAQPLAGALAPAFGIGTPIGAETAGSDAPEQPLPLFFSIWSVIFVTYTVFGIAGLIRPVPWFDRIGVPLLLAGIGNVVWMLSAQLIAYQPLNFLLLGPILAASWWAARAAEVLRLPQPGLTYHLGDAASGLLAGWISVATAISVPLTIRSFTALGPTDLLWAMFWIAVLTAGGLALIFATRVSRSLWFFIALGWGILGIAFNNWLNTGVHLFGHVAAICLILILILRLTWGAKRAKPAS